MRNILLMSTLAFALAVSGTAFEQSTTGATKPFRSSKIAESNAKVAKFAAADRRNVSE